MDPDIFWFSSITLYLISPLSEHLLLNLFLLLKEFCHYPCPSPATLLPPAEPKLVYQPLQPLIKTCPSASVTIPRSLIQSFALLSSQIYLSTPLSQRTLLPICPGTEEGECVASVCMWVCLCVYEKVVTLWMASFRGLLTEHVPGLWAFHTNSPWRNSKQRKQNGKHLRIYRGKDMSLNVWCVFVYNLKVRFDNRALNNGHYSPTQRKKCAF